MPSEVTTKTNIILHYAALHRYAMGMTRNHAEAEDLVQETYVRAIRAIGRTTGEVHKSWLFTILRNIRINELRRQRVAMMVNWTDDTENTIAAASMDPLAIYTSNVDRNTIQEAMTGLSAEHRKILILREIEGLSYEELSTALNCPIGTVMSRLSRARTKLRAMLNASSKSSGENSNTPIEQPASAMGEAAQASIDRAHPDTDSCDRSGAGITAMPTLL